MVPGKVVEEEGVEELVVGVVVPCGEEVSEDMKEPPRVRLAMDIDAGVSPKREKSEKWVVVQVTV